MSISNQGRIIRMGFGPVSAIKAVSADDYLAELNHRLQTHPDFLPGMRFVRHPAGGYDWEPKGYLAPFAEVSASVRRMYVIAPNKP